MEEKIEVTNLVSHFIELLRKANNEYKDLIGIGLQSYLSFQTEKYYQTQTFFYRNQLVRFYDCYYPVSSRYKALITTFKEVENVFEEYPYIVLSGSAGSGKSTIAKHIFLQSIKNAYKIPVLIELRHLNIGSNKLIDVITNKVLSTNAKPSADLLKRALNSGSFLFLFDGYDEIYSSKVHEIGADIESFIDSFPKNKFLVTSRPGSGIENASRFYPFKVRNLDITDIEKFLDVIIPQDERNRQIKELVAGIESENYTEYLKNPLLLSMFVLAFESHPEIPNRRTSFYKNVFDTLYSRHDGITKSSFPRERRTNLQRDDFEKILSAFSYLSYFDGAYSFTEEYLEEKLIRVREKALSLKFGIEDLIYDFQTSIGIMHKEGFEYKFPHRSMQEYFASYFVSRLSSDKKSKAYGKLRKQLVESPYALSSNLFELCWELDEIPLTQNVILPILDSYVNRFKKYHNDTILLKFLNYWQITIEVNNNNLPSKFCFVPLVKNPYFMIKKCNLDTPHLSDFTNKIDPQQLEYSNHSSGNYFLTLKGPYDKKMISTLNSIGAASEVKKHLSSIESWISSTYSRIQNHDNDLEDFL